MKKPSVRPLPAMAAVAMLFSLVAPLAPAPAAADDDQRPFPGVARVSLVQGDVGIRHEENGDAVPAALNAPLIAGDFLSTGDAGSHAEIQVDAASAVRVGYGTQIRVITIESGDRVVQVAQGTIEERVFKGGAPIEIDTPSVTVKPQGPGAYRVGVADDGTSQITIRSGQVDIVGPKGSQTVDAGHTVTAGGTPDSPTIDVADAIARDDFDRFNEDRDATEKTALAESNLPPQMAYDDFDHYGRWVDDASYGQVWAPTVDPDWVPYSDGRWAWEVGYGWTWVAYEPWGWVPYHYGRWFFSPAYGWCWYPPRAAAYVWSPALVAFVGFGPVGVGSIGWVPLGPREYYHPWYGWSGGVFVASTSMRVVDITNVTYVNRRWGRQITIDNWQAGNFAHPLPITRAAWQTAHVVQGALPVVPSKANLRFADRELPARFAKAPVMRGRLASVQPAVRTMPFDRVRSTLQDHVDQVRGTTVPRAQPQSESPQNQRTGNGDAWDRFQRSRGGQQPASGAAPVQNGDQRYQSDGRYQEGDARPPAGRYQDGDGRWHGNGQPPQNGQYQRPAARKPAPKKNDRKGDGKNS